MNNDYLLKAREKVPDVKTLIVLASKRAHDLDYGARPMVRCKEENNMDVALLEISEGLLSASFDANPEDDFLKQIEAVKAAAAAGNPAPKSN